MKLWLLNAMKMLAECASATIQNVQQATSIGALLSYGTRVPLQMDGHRTAVGGKRIL